MPLPTNLLCLDTAGSELMLGITQGGTLSFRHREHSQSQRYHSALLIPLLQRALSETRLAVGDLDALAVNIGPGSFTGIRTGLTTIRLMAQFLERPVYAFNSFTLLAANFPNQTIAVYQDALRGRAYHAVLRLDESGIHYAVAPCLTSLEGLEIPKVDWVLASASLQAALRSFAAENTPLESLESLNLFAPEHMLSLVQQFPQDFAIPWPELLPLYLQEPNITQRQSKPGTLR